MEALLVSFGLVALAEFGDKTQLLALMLASRFHRPVPILAGILIATLLNHLAAAGLGVFVGIRFEGPWMRYAIAASFFAIAVWAVFPDRGDADAPARSRFGVFWVTVCAFFIAEIGDRTQIATAALGARFGVLLPVVAGTTLGMMAANLPAVLLGGRISRWVSLGTLRWGAVALSIALGIASLL